MYILKIITGLCVIRQRFKIYADFECNVKRVKSSDRGDRSDNSSYTEKKKKKKKKTKSNSLQFCL